MSEPTELGTIYGIDAVGLVGEMTRQLEASREQIRALTDERDAMRERCRKLIDDLTALSTMPGVPEAAQMAYQDALSGLYPVMYPLETPLGTTDHQHTGAPASGAERGATDA